MPIDESFKIHLKTQASPQNNSVPNGEIRPGNSSSSVTSSVSKTPSPGTLREDPNTRMDKFCQVRSSFEILRGQPKFKSGRVRRAKLPAKHKSQGLERKNLRLYWREKTLRRLLGSFIRAEKVSGLGAHFH